MMKTQQKGLDMAQLRQYNTKRILQTNFKPIPINTKLTSNPFLKDQQKYHYLIYKLSEYNRRISTNQITDQYEALYYDNLYSVICDLAFLDTKSDQISRLEETFNWAKQQEKFITQRKDQGEVRYQVTKEVRYGVQVERENRPVSEKTQVDEIPSQAVAKAMLPFKKQWRTTHKQLDIPARRLNQYKRKILNIAPFIEPKQQKKAPRVTYPKIPKYQYKVQEPEDGQQPQQGQEGQPAPPPADGTAPPPADGQVKEGEQAANPAEQQQQDLGLGEQPPQPEDQEPPQDTGQDKFAPKVKSYTLQYEDKKRKQYKGPYMFYRGEESEIERRMEDKYLKIYSDQIRKQKQDKQAIDMMQQWASRRSKMQKQHQKRLQNGVFAAKYSFSLQQPPKTEMLSTADQLRLGFTQNIRKPKVNQVQLSSTFLPKLGQQKMFQKSIRRDRLNSLKSKFGKLLNLKQYEQRQVSNSLCQYSSRKRGLSQIIKSHSKSKQRLIQLDQVIKIKQKLARNKVGIDVRSLSMGLCAPQDQQNVPQIIFPDKSLPSNPFMVETKKKKKKK